MRYESMDYAQLEAAVLGSVLCYPKNAGVVFSSLDRSDFSDVCGLVFEALRKLFSRGEPIDEVTLLHELEPGGTDKDSIWPDFLRQLRERGVEHPETHCRMLHELTVFEGMKDEARNVLLAQTPEDAAAASERMIGLLANRRELRRTSAQDAAMSFMQRIDQPRDFIEWGMDGLDYPSTHTRLGDFVVLGGYPSAGKSMLAAQLAQKLGERYRVGFFNLETSEEDLTDRSISRLSGVPLDRILEGELTKNQAHAVYAAAEKYYALQFDAYEAAGATVGKIEAAALAGRYQIIFVDYMQLIRASGTSRYEKVTEISMGLHTLAQRHKILVVALAQLARPEKTSENKKPIPPGMSSFRESGQIEQDADLAMILYSEDPTKHDSRRILKTVKNKKGIRHPNILLDFHGETQLFTEAFPEHTPRPKQSKKPRPQNDQEELPL